MSSSCFCMMLYHFFCGATGGAQYILGTLIQGHDARSTFERIIAKKGSAGTSDEDYKMWETDTSLCEQFPDRAKSEALTPPAVRIVSICHLFSIWLLDYSVHDKLLPSSAALVVLATWIYTCRLSNEMRGAEQLIIFAKIIVKALGMTTT